MAGSPILAAVSWILLAGGTLFQYFVILSGGVYGSPEPLFWFLKAQTGGIAGAPQYTVWSFLANCDIAADSKSYGNCFNLGAANPFRPDLNFNTTAGVPLDFIGSSYYYYISRAMFGFYLVALFFSSISVLSGLLGLCTRLGSFLTASLVLLAFVFQALTAALMTATFVKGRDVFQANGLYAELGAYAFGFTWASVLAFLLASILFCGAGAIGGRSSSSKGSFFSRKRSTRSRGSFRDTENGIKDDYS